MTGLFQAAIGSGVEYRRASVEGIHPAEHTITVKGEGEAFSFDKVVIACGAHTPLLARQIGDHLPIEAEGGYNYTYQASGLELNHPLILADRGIAATSLSSGLRVGGWAVFAGPSSEPKQAYFERIEKIAERTFPPCAFSVVGLGQVFALRHRIWCRLSHDLQERSGYSTRPATAITD